MEDHLNHRGRDRQVLAQLLLVDGPTVASLRQTATSARIDTESPKSPAACIKEYVATTFSAALSLGMI